MKLRDVIIYAILAFLTGVVFHTLVTSKKPKLDTNHERVIDSLEKVSITLNEQLLKNEIVKDSFRNVVIKSKLRYDSLESISLKNTARFNRKIANLKKSNLKELEHEAELVYSLYSDEF